MLFCTVLQKMCIFKELMLLQVNEQRHFFLYIAYQHVSWNYIFSCLNIGTRKDKWVRLHIQESINVSYGFAIVWMLNDYPKHTYPFGKALVNRMLLLGGDVYWDGAQWEVLRALRSCPQRDCGTPVPSFISLLPGWWHDQFALAVLLTIAITCILANSQSNGFAQSFLGLPKC
jgi:hypothetical protein